MTTKGKSIYFVRPIGMLGPIKIGCSTQVDDRLAVLSTWSPFKLEVIYSEEGDYKLEQAIHECFADYHSHREWFHPGERLLAAIGVLLSGGKIADAVDFSDRRGRIRNVTRKTRPVPEFQKELRSYKSRVRGATKRATTRAGESMHAPEDVWAILHRWEGTWRGKGLDGVRPTDEQFDRLEDFIANCHRQSLTRSQKWPKPTVVEDAA